MSTEGLPRFITIDDDSVNNMISKLTIEMVTNKPEVVTFTNPSEGFDFIVSEYGTNHLQRQTVLLLDINMPVMSGWEFLERFDNMKDDVKKLFNIYILSSSVDPRDKQRSYANKNVKGFLVKPLVKDNVLEIIGS